MKSQKTTSFPPCRMVFLDAASLDIGDIQWSSLRKMGKLKLYDHSTLEEAGLRSRDAEVVITNKVQLTEPLFAQNSQLKLVCVAATGVNNIDLESAKKLKVAITNVSGYSTASVVEQTFLFLLAFSHRFLEHHQAALSGEWSLSEHFTLLRFPYSNLQGKTLGIVGYGTIGKQVARLAKVLGMNVLIGKLPGRPYKGSVDRVSLETLLKKSDFVSLHTALTAETRRLIGAARLGQMKKTAYLLNLARGDVVDEAAIVEALKANQLAGYAADVLSEEPPPSGHPFFQKDLAHRVLLSPHIAWASRESRQRLVEEIAKNIRAFLEGKKRNRIV